MERVLGRKYAHGMLSPLSPASRPRFLNLASTPRTCCIVSEPSFLSLSRGEWGGSVTSLALSCGLASCLQLPNPGLSAGRARWWLRRDRLSCIDERLPARDRPSQARRGLPAGSSAADRHLCPGFPRSGSTLSLLRPVGPAAEAGRPAPHSRGFTKGILLSGVTLPPGFGKPDGIVQEPE